MRLRSIALSLALSCAATSFSALAVAAEPTFRFSFDNGELTQMISTYAKATGQKFVVDPSVRGKATLLLPAEVSASEAFNQLSSALALNGFAISEQGDTMVVMAARNIQRSLIPVVSELPPLKPERMVAWSVTLKNVKAKDINNQVRILPSKDGEMMPYDPGNKLVFIDWVSNIHRINKIIGELDVPSSHKKK